MIEAYRVGVNLALTGGITADLQKVGAAFDALNVIIRSTQQHVNGLASGMRGLARVGKSAADAWKEAAAAMERAARAAKAAGGSMRMPGDGGGSGSAASPMRMPPLLMLPAPQTGFTMPGGPYPTGGGSRPLPPNYPLMLQGGGGTFAGGPGSGTGRPMMVPSGAGGGGGGIPLNFKGSGSLPGMPSSGDAMAAGVGFGAVGYALLEFSKSVVGAGVEVGHLQAQLRALGFTQEQSNRALTLAQGAQQSVPGITTGGALEIIKNLAAVMQKAEEALSPDVLSSFSRAAIVLAAAGKGNAVAELFKSMQAGELRGVLQAGPDGEISTDTLQKFLKNVITTTIVTGGRIGPSEQLQFIKSSGLGGAMLSDRSLFADMIAPMLSMGAARAGTGMQAFAQQFSAGKMSDAGANLLMEMGLLNLPAGTDLKQFKSGIGQYRFPANALTGFEDARSNPVEYIMKTLLPKIDEYGTKHYGAAKNDEDLLGQRMATAAAVASRIPGGNLIGDVIRNFALIQRDRDSIAKGTDRDAFGIAQTDPRVKMQALSAALNGLLVALSGPIMDTAIGGIKHITDALNWLSQKSVEYPVAAGRIMEVVAGLGALSAAIAGVAAVLFFAGPMIRVAKWAAAGGAVAAGTANVASGGVLATIAGALARYATPAAGFLLGFQPSSTNNGERDNLSRIRTSGQSMFGGYAGVAPTAAPNMNVELRGPVMMDGRVVGDLVAKGIAKAGAAPSGGTTGFDVRAGTAGGLMGIP